MSAIQIPPTVEETSLSLIPLNLNGSISYGALKYNSFPRPAIKGRAKHFLLNELNLASLSDLTSRKRKLYEHIQDKDTALCKPNKDYKAKNVKKLCDVYSGPVMENICSSFIVQGLRLLAAIIRNSRQKLKGKTKSFLTHSPKSYILFWTLIPLPSTCT
jgi:hypothetical protein